MSFEACIDRALGEELVDADRARLAKERFRELEAEHRAAGLSPEDAAAQAAIDARTTLSREIVAKRYRQLKQLHRNSINLAALSNHRNARGDIDPSDAIRQFLEHDHTARFDSVSTREKVLFEMTTSRMTGLIRRHARSWHGKIRNARSLDDVVRELAGESTGDASARALALGWREAAELARRSFNAAGGDIQKLKGYDLPHAHNRRRIMDDREEWATTLMDALDWNRIINRKTGKPFAAAPGAKPDAGKARAFLDEIHEAIRTDNWSRNEPRMTPRGAGIATQRGHPRELHFKSANDWIAYNTRFGEADPFSAMIMHLRGMARDTAMMEILGPNPRGGLTLLQQAGEQIVKTDKSLTGKAKLRAEKRYARRSRHADDMFGQLDGASNIPAHEDIARVLSGTRQVLTSIQLGSAALSAVSDLGTIGLQASEFGGSGARALNRVASLYNPASKADRATLERAGVIADHLLDIGNSAARFTGETYGGGIAEILPHMTMRLSGLSQMTSIARQGVKLEFMAVLADNAHLAFDEIDEWLRFSLDRRGIDAKDWEAIRATERIDTARGNGFLVPEHIRRSTALSPDAARHLATRLHGIMLEQIELAVPSASLKGRALLIGKSEAGTWLGELGRSGAMYKSFSLSIVFNQLMGRYKRLPPGSREMEIAKFMAVMVAFGALTIQLKEIAKGRDPQPVFSPEYLARALAQGGGFGIFGDLVVSSQTRAGNGLAGTLSGPVVSLASGVIGAPFQTGNALISDEDTNPGRQIAQVMRYNTPVLSSLWYARAAYDRIVVDTIQQLLDPDAEKQWRRREQRQRRDYGNESWWRQGRRTPDRAPDPGGILSSGS